MRKIKVNEIFYSLQGEGYYTGTPAIFVRFSGCNLSCPFCDTQHQKGQFLSEDEICDEIAIYSARLVVITGGEPSLQLTNSLVDKIHSLGKTIAVETNGTHDLPEDIDWITLSPKDEFCENAKVVLDEVDEVKIVYDGENDPSKYLAIPAQYYYLQPCDTGNKVENEKIINRTVDYIKENILWRISLQTQKILKVR